jgi:hypothetical protein
MFETAGELRLETPIADNLAVLQAAQDKHDREALRAVLLELGDRPFKMVARGDRLYERSLEPEGRIICAQQRGNWPRVLRWWKFPGTKP